MTRLLALLLLLLPAPALALSCVFNDLTTVYRDLNAAPETYIVVLGEFRGNPYLLSRSRDAEVLRYQFNGKVVTRSGPGDRFDAPVEVTRSTARPEFADPGGSILSDRPVLVFLQVSGGKYLTSTSICGSLQFYNPTERALRSVSRCMRGIWCQSPRS